MDINELSIKEEFRQLISSLQRLLPKKKDIIIIESKKTDLTRLSDVHSDAKNVFPMCFMGARLLIHSQMLDKVKLVQRYSFGNTKKPYKAFSHLLHKEMIPKSIDDGLVIDTTGSATATYTESSDDFEMRLTSKIKNLVSSEMEVVFERSGEKTIGSVTCSMIDVNPSSLNFVTQWMYQILPEFSIGSEFGFKPLSRSLSPIFSITSRYNRPSFTLSSTIAKTGIQFCIFKQFSPDLRIASIISESISASPIISLALHKNYDNGSELKIFVDSQRCGGFTFQKDVLFYEPHTEARVIRLIVSTIIDKQHRVRFGFGFNLDF